MQDALKAAPAVQKTVSNLVDLRVTIANSVQRKPIEVSTPLPSSAQSPPKRRRVPITIVEPESAPVASSSTTPAPIPAKQSVLLTPVSSRPLNPTTPPSTSDKDSAAKPVPTPGPSAQPKPVPQTFREAKAAREENRPRGGIFRSDGRASLFYAPSPANGNADIPKRETPQTLVAFMRIWETLRTEDERWEVLRVSHLACESVLGRR